MQLIDIKVLVDVKEVTANTKDALAVVLTYSEDVLTGKVDLMDGEKITGDNIKRLQERVVHLGDLKKHQEDRANQILELQSKIAQVQEGIRSEDELIALIEPKLDEAINGIKTP